MPAQWPDFVRNGIPPAFYAPAVTVLWLLALWLAKRIVVRRLRDWASRTTAAWDDLVVDALSVPLNFLILASGVALLSHLLPLPEAADRVATIALQGSLIFAIVLFADNLAHRFMDRKAKAVGNISQGVVKGLIRAFVIGLGALIFLDLIGISITPILASLGIGSLAVALALQETLSNFFAGIHITIDKPFQVGDFIRIEEGGGIEGYVEDIGWRSTRIRQLANNEVIVPNLKLMGSVITNYYQPDRELAVLVQMGVHYDSDLVMVERVVAEVGRDVLKTVPGGVKSFEPFIRYHTFDDSSIHFTVILRGKEFVDGHLIKHEFIKAVHKRFRQEGIVIPYPMRTLTLDRASAADLVQAAAGVRPR